MKNEFSLLAIEGGKTRRKSPTHCLPDDNDNNKNKNNKNNNRRSVSAAVGDRPSMGIVSRWPAVFVRSSVQKAF